jgi:cytochrome P450
VNLIGNGMLALLRDPGQRAIVAADDARLPGAVEELLRYDSPVQMTVRFAFDETPIGAHTAKRGDLVLVLLGAANRDPAEYREPDRLDVGRENAHTHLSFGNGIHYCLGASLARLEGEIAVGALLRRLPGLTLGAEPLSFRAHPVLRGLSALPVTF